MWQSSFGSQSTNPTGLVPLPVFHISAIMLKYLINSATVFIYHSWSLSSQASLYDYDFQPGRSPVAIKDRKSERESKKVKEIKKERKFP